MKLENLSRCSTVLVGFPFSDLTATKVRPALVVSPVRLHRRQHDVILAAISSVLERGGVASTSCLLDRDSGEFAGSGLRVTSVVHCGKLVTVQGTLVLKRLGQLAAPTMLRIDRALAQALGLTASS